MLDSLARRKFEPERAPPRILDSEILSAARGERKSQADEDSCPDMLQFEQSFARRKGKQILHRTDRHPTQHDAQLLDRGPTRLQG